MRLATFNIESLDLPPKAELPIAARAAVLRPLLDRLDADVLCLQEVNGQHVPGAQGRVLKALDALLEGTPYARFERAATSAASGAGVGDVHNLVTLSRWPITRRRQVKGELVEPAAWRPRTADPPATAALPIVPERPLLATTIAHPSGVPIEVVNLHLRAPLAGGIAGGKLAPFSWESTQAWAEGYFLSAIKRTAQALELRLLVDEMLDRDRAALIVAAGDYNAEDHETPLKIAVAAEEDTGNGVLTPRSLVVLDRALPADRRWSVLHHGRPQMLDHILASRTLYGRMRSIDVYNEALGDEAVGHDRVDRAAGSYHAPVVAVFEL